MRERGREREIERERGRELIMQIQVTGVHHVCTRKIWGNLLFVLCGAVSHSTNTLGPTYKHYCNMLVYFLTLHSCLHTQKSL